MLLDSLKNSMILSMKIIALIAMIIFIMVRIKSTRVMQEYAKKVNVSFSIIVGQLLGITYGAGILISEANSGQLSHGDIFLLPPF